MAVKTVPMLLVSDAITAPTGLARITLQIAKGIHEHMSDIIRVGTYGWGAPHSRHLGFEQYTMEKEPVSTEFILPSLPVVWDDFAQGEHGILMSVWDLSRLMWLAIPDRAPQLAVFPQLQKFLLQKPFKRWAYLPIDATGPNDKLTFPLRKSLAGFDRLLAYSSWAQNICANSLENNVRDLDYLPHGIDTSVFFPTNQSLCRKQFLAKTGSTSIYGVQKSIAQDEVLIGIVATNQHRKDYALALETASILKRNGHKIRLWIHTDALERYWSIPSLLIDYGLDKDTLLSGELSEVNLAIAYSACDLTFGIGLGEGFGFPIFESVACGTPCVAANYGGAPENGGGHFVGTQTYRYEGLYGCKRPVYDPHIWAAAADDIIKTKTRTVLPDHLDWKQLWPRWQKWIKDGIHAAR